MSRAQAWLAPRLADVPASLAHRMTAALDDVASNTDPADRAASIPVVLGEAALNCLRAAMPRCDDREAALHLLAADALITSACEAAADADGSSESLRELSRVFATTSLAAELETP